MIIKVPNQSLVQRTSQMILKAFYKPMDMLVITLLDGVSEVDNNAAEMAIKPFGIGRKKFLFSITKIPVGAY